MRGDRAPAPPGCTGPGRASAIAKCPVGTQPLGGGQHLLGVIGHADSPGWAHATLISSEPYAADGASAPNAWRAVYESEGFTAEAFEVHAACLSVLTP